MKKLFITLVFIFIAQLTFSQDAFKSDVKKIIEATGATGPMQMMKEQIMENIPLSKRADFSKEFDASLPALYEKLVKVYMETYTHEDIKEMLKFYDSPVGQKISKLSGEVYKKSTEAGQEWGTEFQSILMKYMQ